MPPAYPARPYRRSDASDRSPSDATAQNLDAFIQQSLNELNQSNAASQQRVNPLVGQQMQNPQVRASHQRYLAQRRSIMTGLKQAVAQRQNILRAAFAGQLVPQDPNDEPAGVLLERVRAERAAREAAKKSRSRQGKVAA